MIKWFISVLTGCCFLLANRSTAQEPKEFETQYIMGEYEADLLEDAQWFFGYGDYLRALPLFVTLNIHYPGTNSYKYYAGICYLKKTDEQEKAILSLEDAYSNDPKLQDILFYLGMAYFVNYKFDEAVGYFKLAAEGKKTSEEYRNKIPRFLGNCENAKQLSSLNNENNLILENIGEPINTEFDEYVPLVSSDESMMIFTYKGKKSKGGLQNIYGEPDPDGEYYEDVFDSYRLGNTWLAPGGLGDKINSNYHDASIALSPDGQSLFIYKDEKGGDIYVSNKERNSWTRPEPIPGEVNTKYFESHASIALNGLTLYFVSDRPGGLGGTDIYTARLQEDNTWGDIKNIGPVINTKYNEDAPFIHANNNLLYFSSEGHNSMGGVDIFYSTLKDGAWEPPDNIGPPVNTPNDDNYYVVSANGERAYFSSARKGGFGGQDIYVIKPGVFGEKPILALIRGIIMNNGEGVEATIKITNITTDESYGIYKSNAASGNYLIALPPGYNYKIDFEIKGKTLHSENVDVNNLGVYVEVEQNIELASKKNPEIDSTNIIQKNLLNKLEDIKQAKGELALEQKLTEQQNNVTKTDASQDTGRSDMGKSTKSILSSGEKEIVKEEAAQEEIEKLYLLDEEGKLIMFSSRNEKGIFNFEMAVIKKDYKFMLESKNAELEQEIIILITDKSGNERLITSKVITATAKEAEYLEKSNVFGLDIPEEEFVEMVTIGEKPASKPVETTTQLPITPHVPEEIELPDEPLADEIAQEKTFVEKQPVEPEPIEPGFENILYDFNKSAVKPAGKKELDKIQNYLENNKTFSAVISGHADSIGTDEYNMQLSENRTRTAAAYLVDLGMDENRLKLLAYGESIPIAPNSNKDGTDNPKGRQMNRRVEFSENMNTQKPGLGKPVELRPVKNKKTTVNPEKDKSKNIFYKVQVAAYKHPENYDNKKLDEMGRLDSLNIEGITRFTIGLFESIKEAKKLKKLIVKNGTTDAFITAEVNGDRKYLEQLSKKMPGYARNKKTPSAAALAAYQLIINKYGTKKVPGLEFYVQVAAYKHPENYDKNQVSGFGYIDALKLEDNITRFTIGNFSTLKDAETFKKKVLETCVDDVFVTACYNGKRILVKDLIRNNFYAI